jgi:hypothetical protein
MRKQDAACTPFAGKLNMRRKEAYQERWVLGLKMDHPLLSWILAGFGAV